MSALQGGAQPRKSYEPQGLRCRISRVLSQSRSPEAALPQISPKSRLAHLWYRVCVNAPCLRYRDPVAQLAALPQELRCRQIALPPQKVVCVQGFPCAFIDNRMQEPKVVRTTACHVSEDEYVVSLVIINAPAICRTLIWIRTRPKCVYPDRRPPRVPTGVQQARNRIWMLVYNAELNASALENRSLVIRRIGRDAMYSRSAVRFAPASEGPYCLLQLTRKVGEAGKSVRRHWLCDQVDLRINPISQRPEGTSRTRFKNEVFGGPLTVFDVDPSNPSEIERAAVKSTYEKACKATLDV